MSVATNERTVCLTPKRGLCWLPYVCTELVDDRHDEYDYINRHERIVTQRFRIARKDGTVIVAEPGDRLGIADSCSLGFGTHLKLIRTHLLRGIVPDGELRLVDDDAVCSLMHGRSYPDVSLSPSDLPSDMRVVMEQADIREVTFEMPEMNPEFEGIFLGRFAYRQSVA